jgi:hypothetical protein
LECVIRSSDEWASGPLADAEFVELIKQVVAPYRRLWLRHSRTMRLSSVESLQMEAFWEETKTFIQTYGADLLHSRLLTLGNVRVVLHRGVDAFLNDLGENQEADRPIRLLQALEAEGIDFAHAVDLLELIYNCIVDRFDRFLEYNTTTTQSDYGDRLYSLLDFLRAEAAYERDEWNLKPASLAHEMLARLGKDAAAQLWEKQIESATESSAEAHLEQLEELESTYSMRLPTLTDHLNERFVKPLAIDRMTALVPRAFRKLDGLAESAAAFNQLRDEIDAYLETTWGSGIDVPQWLQSLEREVSEHIEPLEASRGNDAAVALPLKPKPLTLRSLNQQLKTWYKEPGGSKQASG